MSHWQYNIIIFIIIAINNQHHGHHLINFIIFYVILNIILMMFIGWFSFFEGINNLSRAVYRADVSSANLYLCCTVPACAGSSVLLCYSVVCGVACCPAGAATTHQSEGGGRRYPRWLQLLNRCSESKMLVFWPPLFFDFKSFWSSSLCSQSNRMPDNQDAECWTPL